MLKTQDHLTSPLPKGSLSNLRHVIHQFYLDSMDSRNLCVYREEGGVNSGQSCGMEQGKTQRQRTQRRGEDHKEPSQSVGQAPPNRNEKGVRGSQDWQHHEKDQHGSKRGLVGLEVRGQDKT